MIRIKGIANEDEMHVYDIQMKENLHDELTRYFSSLNFPREELDKLDVIFSEMVGGWLYIHKPNMKVHFFITVDTVKMVMDSNMSQDRLSATMKNYFVFPK